MFQDRRDAGVRLGQALVEYRERGALVLAIPRGGVPVGLEVARALRAEFSVIVIRKLPFPDNPESGFGAVAEDGSTVFAEDARSGLAPEVVGRVLEEQQREMRRRVRTLRRGVALPEIEGRLVILVDDGLAMGSTMRAAALLCRKRRAGGIVVAVPVSGARAFRVVSRVADRVVVLEQPPHFRAVAEVYREWRDLTDADVLALLASQGGTPPVG
jgi:putative phosphoribosyl transferase